MYLIVGLGNYGDKYTYTRHNVGFLFADALARQLDTKFSQKPELQGEVAEVRDAHEKYILLKPQTYMNRSGEAIARTMTAYNIPLSNVVVVSDDSNLDFGTVRIRFGGEAGGHNGLKSVMGTSGADFWRVRVGIGGAPERVPLEAWVLAGLSDEDLKILHDVFNSIMDEHFTAGVHLQEKTLHIS